MSVPDVGNDEAEWEMWWECEFDELELKEGELDIPGGSNAGPVAELPMQHDPATGGSNAGPVAELPIQTIHPAAGLPMQHVAELPMQHVHPATGGSNAGPVAEPQHVHPATGPVAELPMQNIHPAAGGMEVVENIHPAAGGMEVVAEEQPRGGNDEFRDLELMAGWGELKHMIVKQLKVNPRHALSYHTTTACQAGKEEGPAGSLKSSGLDTRQEQDGGFVVQLRLVHAFACGDKLTIQYSSPNSKTFKDAQQIACVELLAFLLVSAPDNVLMHPNNWKESIGDIEKIRKAARAIHASRVPSSSGRPNLADRVKDEGPRRPQAVVAPPGLGQPLAASPALDDVAINLLQESLTLGRAYGPQGARVPAVVGRGLKALLPKKGFGAFLKRYSHLFKVEKYWCPMNGKWQYSFTVLDVWQPAVVPAVGGDSRPSAAFSGGHWQPAAGGGSSSSSSQWGGHWQPAIGGGLNYSSGQQWPSNYSGQPWW
jgi:hypothetical protein